MVAVLDRIVEKIRKWREVVVVGHYDADGITATAIAVEALERAGKDVSYVNLKQLYSDDVVRLKEMGEHFLFVDFGAGQVPFLRGNLDDFVVVDHHRKAGDYPFLLHADDLGALGERDVSGAGLTYILAKRLADVSDMAKIAIVGAVGDMQIRNGRLVGLNREILVDAIRAGDVFAYRDLALYGRVSRPLPYMLMFSTDPILPGLTANEPGCFRFLERAGIDVKEGETWRTYVDLSQAERRRLFTSLSYYLMHRGWDPSRISRLIGEVYDLTAEDAHSPLREVREFATLLNATGRHGHPDVGVEVARGDRGKTYEEALRLWSRHKRMIREGIEWLLERGVEEGENIYFFHARDRIAPTIVGIVAGMVYGSGLVPTDRPIVAMAYENEWVKVSARATSALVSRGLDLSLVMRRAAGQVGGEGGGHRPAAGARIPRGTEEEFLAAVDREVARLLHPS